MIYRSHSKLKMVVTVQTSLQDYFAQVLLSGDNQYRCDSCGRLSDANLLTALSAFPKVLTLRMILFKRDKFGNVTKIDRSVAVPTEIDMSSFSDSSSVGQMYRLNAVVSHAGESRTEGHYDTIARDPNYGKWLVFDDLLVHELSEEEVYCHLGGVERGLPNPYLLFYSRYEKA